MDDIIQRRIHILNMFMRPLLALRFRNLSRYPLEIISNPVPKQFRLVPPHSGSRCRVWALFGHWKYPVRRKAEVLPSAFLWWGTRRTKTRKNEQKRDIVRHAADITKDSQPSSLPTRTLSFRLVALGYGKMAVQHKQKKNYEVAILWLLLGLLFRLRLTMQPIIVRAEEAI